MKLHVKPRTVKEMASFVKDIVARRILLRAQKPWLYHFLHLLLARGVVYEYEENHVLLECVLY
jgi:hypothetical protein